MSSLLSPVLFVSSHANCRKLNVASKKNQTGDATYTVTSMRRLLTDQPKAFNSAKTFEAGRSVDS